MFYITTIVFVAVYLNRIDFSRLSGVEFNLYIYFMAVLVGIFSIAWGGYIWLLILKYLGAKDVSRYSVQLFYVYAKSWLARYIPGTAPWILGKIYFASTHGIQKKKLLTSSALEALLQIIATIIISILLILISKKGLVLTDSIKYILIIGTAICTVIIQPKIFNKIVKIIFSILKRPVIESDSLISYKLNFIGISLYSISTLLTGLALFLVALAVYPQLQMSDAYYVMGVGTLSGVIGMLAIFVPSGLGVREGVQIALLSAIVPVDIAVIIAISSRLWSIIVDILFYFITVLLLKLNKSNISNTN